MEFNTMIFSIVVVVMVGIIVIMLLLYRYNAFRPKSDLDQSISKLKETFEAEKQVIIDTKNVELANAKNQIAVLTTQKARLNEKLSKKEQEEEERKNQILENQKEEEDSVEYFQKNYDINPSKAIEIVKSLNMNPEALTNPALTPLLWEKLNENRDLSIIMGIVVPKGTSTKLIDNVPGLITQQTTEIETDPIDKLFKELEKQGHIA